MTAKWNFKMEWCKKQRVSPANTYFWKQAEEAYNEQDEATKFLDAVLADTKKMSVADYLKLYEDSKNIIPHQSGENE